MFRKTILQSGFALALLALLTAGVTSAQEKKLSGYTIYYLKHTDATQVAKSLEMLLGPGVATLNTPIVAEPRLNALFINAPEETLKQVEQLLKMLDQPQQTEPTEIKVFVLKNIRAADAEHTVITFAGPSVRISTDAVTNSLIISGRKEDVLTIQALLEKLDEKRASANRVGVAAFELEHISPQKAVGILKELRTSASIAVDETKDRLLVSGDETALQHLRTIVEMIDTPDRRSMGSPVQVRLVWLMEDKEQEAELQEINEDLAKVANVVEKRLGLSRLKKVTQLLVNVEPDSARNSSEFSVLGETGRLDMPVNLEFKGEFTGNAQGRPVIGLEIAVVQSGTNNNGLQAGKTMASIETKVTAPVGHSVVLGVTSISSTSSVFILQVLPADADSE